MRLNGSGKLGNKVRSSFILDNLGKNVKHVSNKCGSTVMTKIILEFPQEIMKVIIIRFMTNLLSRCVLRDIKVVF